MKSTCPICEKLVRCVYNMSNKDNPDYNTVWYHCSCGVCFNDSYEEGEFEYPDGKVMKEFSDKVLRHIKFYAPILTELTSGAKMSVTAQQEVKDEFTRRGMIVLDEYQDGELDVMWYQDTFHWLADPVGEVNKIARSLNEYGVVYISMPDTDFKNELGVTNFPHWYKHFKMLWNKQAIIKEFARYGFQPILTRSNYTPRFINIYDMHIILQKIY